MSAPTAITGTILFPDDVPADPAATIVVRLEDVSHADAPATIVSSVSVTDVTITPASDPVTFSLPVDSFDPRARYTVRVHVDRDGDGEVSKGDLISTSHIPVLTQGGGTTVQVPVELV
jgi:putative lipoprotein